MTNIENRDILIVGGNSAGLQASLDLADSGIKVHIVEGTPFLSIKSSDSVPKHIFNTRLLEVSRHPNITVWTNSRINRCVGELGNFQIEIKQDPRYVDLNRCTACGECLEVCPVTVPGTDHKVIYMDGQPGCMAIDKFGVPPCTATCPGGIHVQGYVALIAQGRFQEAIDLIRDAIPFPGICGRVCTHPCEINCRRNQLDKPVAVRHLKRFLSDWELEQEGERIQPQKNETQGSEKKDNPSQIQTKHNASPNSRRVAVIGAGPGGMAVADRLARQGYQVTVFEKLPVIGGMMSIGIPAYRLPRDVIAREYQRILDLGVEIKLNVSIGPHGDHTLDDLFRMGYDAICLAIGAHKSQSLHIPGEELNGVVHGIDILKTINLSHQLDDSKIDVALKEILCRGKNTRIAILGGGNTAMDVSRSLKRLHLQDITVYYRRTRTEMPALPEEVDDAEQEGINLEYLVSPLRILGDEHNRVIGLECIRMKLGEPDSSGRRRPIPIEGSEFVVDLDLVVLAIGQKPDLDDLGLGPEVTITEEERIGIRDHNFMTHQPGVFAVGDAVTRDKMAVIEAIGMGKKAASAIDLYLQGKLPQRSEADSGIIQIANREMTEDELTIKTRIPVSTIPLKDRVKSFTEVEIGYTEDQAIQEAQRCLACGPCSECQACVQVCKPMAIIHNQKTTLIDFKIGTIIFSEDSKGANSDFLGSERPGIFQIKEDDPLIGSAVAAQAARALNQAKVTEISQDWDRNNHPSKGFTPWLNLSQLSQEDSPLRNGVFICECGDQIAKYIDTEAIRNQAASWPGVIHAQVIPFSCSPAGAATINSAIQAYDLNRIVLAGCSCCSLDHICYSCTFQRVRCKENFKLFTHPERSSALGTIDQAVKFVMVNIREQCAWIHTNDRQIASAKATEIVGASVARAMATPTKIPSIQSIDRSALVCGNGDAGKHCMEILPELGISAQLVDKYPIIIQRMNGKYTITQNGVTCQASTLILAPKDCKESHNLLSAFGEEGYRPRILSTWGDLDTNCPGVFLLNPEHYGPTAGAAGASRVSAWLGRIENRPLLTSVVNTSRCRACGTCVEICEFGAPDLMEEDGFHASWIDPIICTGCGTCVAHCPSGAITAGYSTDSQIEAMLSVILANSN
jgi:NADPH-dependent glutamate synthase beta subunit-like oxidoreductase/Pyruvate/2-oxoacid:ferredoxin oxidoreductase delta subunit